MLPVADGAWEGEVRLPSHGEALLHIDMPFGVPPLEDDSTRLHINGELYFVDHTGFLGMRSMDLTSTSFQAEIDATRSER